MTEIDRADLLQQFASDNYAGICPEAWAAMEAANHGHVSSYGDDPWTVKASNAFRELFETECEVFFAFNGTAANSLALASLCQSYHGVICCNSAHVETDECGAPEFFSNGSKLLVAECEDGKLTPNSIHEIATKRQDIHFPKPHAVTITQSTETGRVYSLAELRAISEVCRTHGLYLHMDGARFANACASLACSPAEMTWKSGIDVLCFGGTKNGMAIGEAVLFFDRKLAIDFDYRCKQAGQLASKMRFLAAPWVGLLENGAWLRNAAHANMCARYFAEQIAGIPNVKIASRIDANAVFLLAPEEVLAGLRKRGWKFYTFIGGAARFMFAWDTDLVRIDALSRDLREVAEEFSTVSSPSAVSAA
ncbi:threonine aldolase family protein [Acidisarcina polymorpha]|uniref:threonine aldolase family protein n=1 Tax=Acidisarcina polymorpha TaxID=2211140 RepID=UPI001F1E6086|nr:low specificity L-threonine aldolase [Acidisarcina polymorpha]